ncbi:MAG: RidA family protein [Alphaproteobacteria bacterium]|nr:RidA family protein [Alphaproteobacteria bacterium]
MTNAIEAKLAEKGLVLPEAALPAANYVPATISGNLIYVSGQLPMKDGKPQGIGKLGREFTIEQGQEVARQCVLNVLAHVRANLNGDLTRVKRVLRLGIFVASAEGFTDQPKVANGASDLIVELFGDKGKHARAAVGVAELPFGVAVEVEATVEFE